MVKKFTRRAFLVLSGKVAAVASFSSTVLSNVKAAMAQDRRTPHVDDCGSGYGYGYGYGTRSCDELGFD